MKDDELAPTSDPDSPTKVYIPANLQDCFQELDRMLPTSVVKSFRLSTDADPLLQHFGLGMWMRNNWGLWSDWSRLKQYLDSLGIHDADDASSLILVSYWGHLNPKP